MPEDAIRCDWPGMYNAQFSTQPDGRFDHRFVERSPLLMKLYAFNQSVFRVRNALKIERNQNEIIDDVGFVWRCGRMGAAR